MKSIHLKFPSISAEQWKQLVQVELQGKEFNSTLVWKSIEGINVKPYFTTDDVDYEKLSYSSDFSKTKIIAYYNQEKLSDVDGFIVENGNDINEVENQFLFFKNKESVINLKNKNFLLFDLFTQSEKTANYNINIQEAKEILNLNIFKKSLLIDISLHQNAGASVYQQIGIAFAKANEYINLLGKTSIKKIFFKFSIGYNYFFEIAKLRVFRTLWNNFTKTYQINVPAFILCENSKRNKSNLDQENNLIRSAFETTTAFIGNADAIFINNYKYQNSEKDEILNEIAYKQALILKEEANLSNIINATNGAYYIESIIIFLKKQAWDFFLDIEKIGGYLEALKLGFIQKRIISQAEKEQNAFNKCELVLIGVNKLRKDNKQILPKKINYNFQIIQEKRLAESFE